MIATDQLLAKKFLGSKMQQTDRLHIYHAEGHEFSSKHYQSNTKFLSSCLSKYSFIIAQKVKLNSESLSPSDYQNPFLTHNLLSPTFPTLTMSQVALSTYTLPRLCVHNHLLLLQTPQTAVLQPLESVHRHLS